MPQLSQYDSVDSLSSSAKEIFMANASVPAFGPTEQGGSNGNYNIPVSEIGSSLPAISAGDGGKVLTVNSNEDGAMWDDVPGELPDIGASDAGKVLTVNSNSDDVVWSNLLPSYASAQAGMVLAINSQGTGLTWANAASETVTLYYDTTNNRICTTDTFETPLTIAEILAAYDDNNGNIQVFCNKSVPVMMKPTMKTSTEIEFSCVTVNAGKIVIHDVATDDSSLSSYNCRIVERNIEEAEPSN